MSGRVTQIDYFNNGRLDHIVKNPPITIDTTKPYVPVIAPVIPGWNGIDGYGNIDVIKALTAATGKTLAAVAPSVSVGWGISNAHFDAANAAGYTGKGIVIAAIDSGIDMNNKALTGNLSKYSWNFLSDDCNLQDDNGHGTFVASELIATDVGNGVVGAVQGAQLMVLKALNAKGNGAVSTVAKAVTYAVDHGANIISMSIGGTITMPSIQEALKYAMSHDVFVAIAAGNAGANSPDNPASYAKGLDTVVSVGSSTQSASGASTFSYFSNKTGTNDTPYPFVTAAGAAIKGYNQCGQVVTCSGTSMATPYVAAEMAILEQASIAINPNATHATLVQNVIGCMTQNTQALSLVGTLPIPTSLVG
jgi:subtilisin family serine protease